MYYTGIDLHKDMSLLTTINTNGELVEQEKVGNNPASLLTYFQRIDPQGSRH